MKRLRRCRAIDELDRRAGMVDAHGDLNQVLSDIRKDDPERP
ncbi:hypothetical protein [Salinibacter sp.]|nr:hypothetical protein [Salinibacter sp.]